jgi:hypothetical protein
MSMTSTPTLVAAGFSANMLPTLRELGGVGYWIVGSANIQVEFEQPTFWRKVTAKILEDKTWVSYK